MGRPFKYLYMRILLVFFLSAITLSVWGQRKFVSADEFPLFGKISDDTETRYERLPASLKSVSRDPVWKLGKNTAGLYLRFRTDSKSIALRWVLNGNNIMDHMAITGIKSFDLYGYENGKWVYANTARTKVDTIAFESVVISDMDGSEREYLLNFPLYNGVASLEIGIDETASISPPKLALPVNDKPVICYGTSILQGGCASRPGMAHTNILTRRFNRTFINLGFSGNALLDYEIAELIAGREASLIILDFMPNVSAQQTRERMEKFYEIIRAKQPLTPIFFIENPVYPPTKFNLGTRKTVEDKNIALHEIFDKIKRNDKNIKLISSAGMIGDDNEATVDGTHFTDLGFMRYADYLTPFIKKVLKK